MLCFFIKVVFFGKLSLSAYEAMEGSLGGIMADLYDLGVILTD